VIDNIQIKIRNIHIRIENQNKYAFGITLGEFSLHTTNEKWEKIFVDRASKPEAFTKLLKQMVILRFAIYWSPNPKSFIANLNTYQDQEHSIQDLITFIKTGDNILELRN